MIDGVSISGFQQSPYSSPFRDISGEERKLRGENVPEDGSSTKAGPGRELSEKEKKQVRSLEERDRKVRAHEAAHQAAAGGLARGKSFSYQKGPDGKQYAVGGEVQIDTSTGSTPQETITRMQQIKRAALAPSDPSGQDQKVAQQATAKEADARAALLEQTSPGGTQKTSRSRELSSERQKNSSGKNSPGKNFNSKLSVYKQGETLSSTAVLGCTMCGAPTSCYHAA